jgi:transcription elongation factor Elf1
MTCPICNSTNVEARPKQRGLYPLGPVAIFGLPFAMLHQASEAQQFHCAACGQVFQRRTTAAQIARVLLLFFGVAFGLLIIIVIIAFVITQSR